MQYTTLGRTGLRVSRLGFGCMRFPMTAEGRVDRDLAIPLLHRAVELGVTYFDTAIFYCHGDSQRAVGEAFEGKMREQVVLSTKNHMHEAPDDAWWARLEESLTFLRTSYIDVYNLHGMTWDFWQRNIDGPAGKYRLLQKAKDQGLIRNICCSFHDSTEGLVKLIETGAFASITLQYNLLNRGLEPAFERARELNVGITVMGPVGGGRLGVDSARIKELTGGEAESTPEAAFRFVLAHPAVHIALSGMSSIPMLEQNVDIISNKAPFTQDQIAAIDAEVERVKTSMGVPCTACGYCMPCPYGVDIPGNFGVFNEYRIYGLREHAVRAYAGQTGRAAVCTECGACLAKCPQKIQIPTVLRTVTAELDEDFTGFGSLIALTGVTAEGDVQVQVTTKNLTDAPIGPSVELTLEDGARAEPATTQLAELGPMSTVTESSTVLVPDGVGILRGELTTISGEEAKASQVFLPFLIAPREQMRWHTPLLLARHFAGREDVLATHNYRIGLRHDDEKLYVAMDIKSQLHALGESGASAGGRIEFYADLRPPRARRPPRALLRRRRPALHHARRETEPRLENRDALHPQPGEHPAARRRLRHLRAALQRIPEGRLEAPPPHRPRPHVRRRRTRRHRTRLPDLRRPRRPLPEPGAVHAVFPAVILGASLGAPASLPAWECPGVHIAPSVLVMPVSINRRFGDGRRYNNYTYLPGRQGCRRSQ